MINWRVLATFLFFVSAGLIHDAHATITIEICTGANNSTGDCPAPPGPTTSGGASVANPVHIGGNSDTNRICTSDGLKCLHVGNQNTSASSHDPTYGEYFSSTAAGYLNPVTPPSVSPNPPGVRAFSTDGLSASSPDAAAQQVFQKDKAAGTRQANATLDACTGATTNNATWTCVEHNPGTTGHNDIQVIYKTSSCDSGYTATGSVCNLTNQAVVVRPADGHCNIVRSGNSYSADGLDPDCGLGTLPGTSTPTASSAVGAAVTTNAVTATVPGVQTVSVSTNASTGVTAVTNSIINSNGTTTVNTVSESAPASGSGATTVTGGSTSTVVGTGTNQTTTPVTPTTDTTGLATAANQVNAAGKLDAIKAGQCGGTGQPSCSIDFCATNPDSPMCKITSASATCGAPPSCDGDAVQCAVLVEAHRMSCDLSNPTDASDLGTAIASGHDPAAGDLPTKANGESIALGSSSFDQSAWLSGSCVSDVTVTLFGHDIVLPFSNVCSTLELVGNVFVAICFLVALRIVFA